ncbi:ribonuclease III [Streptomyces katsurahamanus]|uniref:ribonuclease III n=1 Tax=Streptomyces katsurahamanus TaxID=2577098 RepID=UPI001E34D92E|nr:ribonuclease III [Streptomyces katsurahamanus]
MSELSSARKSANTGETVTTVNAASSHTLLEGRLGYQLESALLVRALTHRSYAYENGGLPTNERLEFLGDSVLGLVVTDTLYRTHPDLPEGQLAKLRAAVVNSRALAEVGRGLELGSFIRLGRGEEGTGGRDKASILADTLEAVIGAVYLDQGLEAASELVHRLFDPLIEKSSNLGAGLDWKTSLQELTAAEGLGVPEYLVTETGPDHEKTFTAAARVGGVSYGTGTGRSKKEAEQQAAESAWREIRAAADQRAEAAKAEAAKPDAASAAKPDAQKTAEAAKPDAQKTAKAEPEKADEAGSGEAGADAVAPLTDAVAEAGSPEGDAGSREQADQATA